MTPLPYSIDQLRPHYEKTALARMGIPIERALSLEGMRVVLVAAEKAIQEAAADMVGYCGKDPEQLADPLRRAADARIAIRAALVPNAEITGRTLAQNEADAA